MAAVAWRARVNRYSALAYGFLVLFLLTTLGSVAYAVYKDRETQLERSLQRVQGNALVFEDQITQTLQWVENMMRSLPEVADVSLLHADPKSLERLLQKLQYSQPALRSFFNLHRARWHTRQLQRPEFRRSSRCGDLRPARPLACRKFCVAHRPELAGERFRRGSPGANG